ncbi:MAG: peptide chain release factor N(5)-glutamine methyltransferase [Muribaculaceae bacterium]
MKQTIDKIRTILAPLYSQREIETFIRIIFENLLRYSPVDIIMHKDSILSDYMKSKIDKVIDDLVLHRPIQYIFGNTYFHGYHFEVTPDTLIPRPETEELIDIIIDENNSYDLSVLDIGTGSGCIAISLALALKFATVVAVDISPRAIEVAKRNAKDLHANIDFQLLDILSATPPAKPIYDIIVSNPPYICNWEKATMDDNVLNYEPSSALFVSDDDPLLFYRTIAQYSQKALKPLGTLYFEINNRYADITVAMLKDNGYCDITIHRDIHKLPRMLSAHKIID